MSIDYPKIPCAFKRDPDTKKLTDEYREPEFELLAHVDWRWTEKLDGMNVVVHWDGHRVSYQGRTERAQLPAGLVERLNTLFVGDANEELFEQLFGADDVILYGEGIGGRIQHGKRGGRYTESEEFRLFDVRIGGVWLQWEDVCDVAQKLGLQTVPYMGAHTLHSIALRMMVEHEQGSVVSAENPECTCEGYVGVPVCGLLNRRGERLQVKLKYGDFA